MPESFRNTTPIRLVRALHRAMRFLNDQDKVRIAGYDLQVSEFDVIATLGNTEGMRMCDIAGRMLTSAPNVTRIVKRLEERGLVERRRGVLSDREVVARLTEQGEAVFNARYPEHYRFLKDYLDGRLSEDEQSTLADLLERLPPPTE